MTELSTFSLEEQTLLIRLPYQVGFHISEADDVEGIDDDEKEMRALRNILRALPGLYENHPLVREIFSKTLENENEWGSWQEGTFDLSRECSEAIAALKAKSTKDEARYYRKALLEVADAVARAAAEHGVLEIRQEPDNKIYQAMKGFFQIFSSRKNNPLSNISPAEQAAIDKINAALSID